MLSRDMERTTPTVKRGSLEKTPEDSLSVSDVADLLSMSTIRDSAVRVGATPTTTSKRSARSTTENDMGYSGTEPLDFVLSLPKKEQQKWVLLRLAAFQEAMVLYATVAQQTKDTGKSVTEAEWQAILATDGITRAVPQEQHIYEWILRK